METLLDGLGNFLIALLNYLIAGVGIVLNWLFSVFPNSPFSEPAGVPASIDLGYIAWLLPFSTLVKHGLVLCGAILVYYSIRVLARWVKVVKG